MKVYLAADHAGFELKEHIKKFLIEKDFLVEDMGAHTFDPQDDYPDCIAPAAKKLSEDSLGDKDSRAIIFGGSGQGEAIVANRFKGVRAIVYYGQILDMVLIGAEHNVANALSLGARYVEQEEAERAVIEFLEFDKPIDLRHKRRALKIEEL
jgi:ribose 5-phosphate isomerase B